jgi:nucleoside-diphosphate-sugar epimerase
MDRRSVTLVIGATGGFGGEVTRALLARGWPVRALHRDPQRAKAATGLTGLDWVKGDAMTRDDVRRAAEGAGVIVHAANPPGYRNWAGTAGPMLDNTIAAAVGEAARILLPGNVYNYGPDAFPLIDEAAPQHPPTRKGAIRVEMERRLHAAAQAGAKVLVIRAGDFFGASGAANWMGFGIFRAGKPLRSLAYPGPLGVRHAWAYLPDLAEASVRLLEREADLSADASFHFQGHAVDGHELAAAFAQAVGRRVPVTAFPWFAVQAAGPFNETLRELAEMRYLWRDTVLLDNARLVAELGEEPRTPLPEALAITLRALGCLAEAPQAAA